MPDYQVSGILDQLSFTNCSNGRLGIPAFVALRAKSASERALLCIWIDEVLDNPVKIRRLHNSIVANVVKGYAFLRPRWCRVQCSLLLKAFEQILQICFRLADSGLSNTITEVPIIAIVTVRFGRLSQSRILYQVELKLQHLET